MMRTLYNGWRKQITTKNILKNLEMNLNINKNIQITSLKTSTV